MAKHYEIKANYQNKTGSFTTWDKVEHQVKEDSNPYQYLLGALSGCFYSTFCDIAQSMQVNYEKLEMDIKCTKRAESPTTMKTCTMNITAYGVENPELFCKAIDKCTQTCSIYQTLNLVAQITVDVEFL